MWNDPYESRPASDRLKAVASVAAIGLGLWISGLAGSLSTPASPDITGVWRWVETTSLGPRSVDALLELRRADDGRLEARLLRRDASRQAVLEGSHSVVWEDGILCLETDKGTALKGRVLEDGSAMSGLLEIRGVVTPGRWERVVLPAARADTRLGSLRTARRT